ncbi:MAG: anthranilate synthase component I [Phycisphaerales bacterium]|nr:anthranilate synthase component I [Phycisphaerales bacterium]
MDGLSLTFEQFEALARRAQGGKDVHALAVPLGVRLLGDQLTPVVAYRRLVAPDERTAPSFLLESVEGGERQGRYSILGAHPMLHVIARGEGTEVRGDLGAVRVKSSRSGSDPLSTVRTISKSLTMVEPDETAARFGMPGCFLGGWVGFAGYDTVRYVEPNKLPFSAAPEDDRALPDLHMAFYGGSIVFDHAKGVVYVIQQALTPANASDQELRTAYDLAKERIDGMVDMLRAHTEPMTTAVLSEGPHDPMAQVTSTMTKPEHAAMVARAKEYICAGDIFQVVLGQRFERKSGADPFDVYRALRVVNPSPYMVYMQAEGCILIASSPEILCRAKRDASGAMIVTNRPLAGTRRRGRDAAEDAALERELLADHKERAEHVMLVDLGRNDVGRVACEGSVELAALMEIERYSHVMHISSTVTGTLRDGLDAWDALRAALPVGTISGAPKVRAMQIIDELEPVKRGPYGGGLGYVGLDGQMDIALALRTMVVPVKQQAGDQWIYHCQAAGGIVYDSEPDAEYQETVNKAAALVRAIDVAERALRGGSD